MFRKKSKRLFGSSRPAYFREPQRPSGLFRRRHQQVHVRPRYLLATIGNWARGAWSVAKFLLIVGGLGAGLFYGVRFFETSPFLRVSEVAFSGDVPPALRRDLPVRPGQNIFKIRTGRIENEALRNFPELKSISVRRGLQRKIVVEGIYREAVALIRSRDRLSGLDSSGRIFPVGAHNTPAGRKPVIEGAVGPDGWERLALSLAKIQTEVPSFYSVIKELETDRIQPLKIELVNGIQIFWGREDPDADVEKAKNMSALLGELSPRNYPGTVRFIDRDRLVIDANWKSKSAP